MSELTYVIIIVVKDLILSVYAIISFRHIREKNITKKKFKLIHKIVNNLCRHLENCKIHYSLLVVVILVVSSIQNIKVTQMHNKLSRVIVKIENKNGGEIIKKATDEIKSDIKKEDDIIDYIDKNIPSFGR